MYSSISDQLTLNSQHCSLSAQELRRAAVKYLSENSGRIVDVPTLIQTDSKYKDFDNYLQIHSMDGAWGDEVMLRAISQYLGLTIAVWHDNGHVTRVNPDVSTTARIINIGHLGEKHYVSLRPLDQVYIGSTSVALAPGTDMLDSSKTATASSSISSEKTQSSFHSSSQLTSGLTKLIHDQVFTSAAAVDEHIQNTSSSISGG